MRRLFLVLSVVLTSVLVKAQTTPTEICNNGIDDDFDGFIDCYDGSCANNPLCDGLFLGNDAACEAVPPAFPQFTMALDFASPNETTNHLSRMAIGDLNRDGVPEIVTMNRYTKKLFILNGSDGSVQRETTVTWEPYWEIAIANLDNDNCGEIFFIGQQDPPGNNNSGVYIFAYDCQLNKLWETAQRLKGDPINFGIADFDGDGQEELYAKDEIYDAKTGTRIVASTGNPYNRINGGPVAVNIVGDDKLELILGLNIYQVNLGTRAANTGSLTLLQSRNEYFVRNEYNATSVADYNLDGFLDVLASGSTGNSGANTTVFFWDVKNNTIKTFSDPQPSLGGNYTNGWVNGTGRLNVADLDGNGLMNASYVSGRFLYALDENFNLLWRVSINEETSGHTGCTLFDFNGDGKAEIVYRDERFIYIIEGTDGSVYSQQACISRTNREYPIVADVDADGSTELCVACGYKDANAAANFNNLDSSRYSHIRVFKSAAEPWVPARRVWNQHGYFVVNVNDDLTIPTKLQPHQLVFSTGNCTQGPNRPLNKFLNQSPYLNSEGCPTYAAPDIAFHVAPTIIPPTCPSLDFKVSFKLTNLGDVAVTGNIPVSFYDRDPMQAGAAKLATIDIPVSGLSNGDIVSIDNQVVTGNGSAFVYVVLNDAGTSVPTPIVLPNSSFIECDYDNIRFAAINPIPNALTGLEVSPNETCSGSSNGVARAFVPIPGGGENTTDYNFYWSIGNTAKPIPADYVGAVYSGIPAGTYTVFARHKTANCNTTAAQVTIGTTTAPFPPITINVLSNQTSCSPFNGKLEAVIQGGGAGYTIDWYDIALNDLGITGPIASNLKAGSYVAVVRKGTCNTSVPATVNPPTVPDAQADVLQDVVDCSNPNSGSVTADALVSGVIQNPDNYTFTWYEYDQTNNVRGSVLAGIHGTGHTRTGLPVGFYQVEVKENSSQCASTILPIVEIESDLDIPDAPEIVIISSQTSCDPTLPNGVMTANVTVGGVPQNPVNFTFEWFEGQTTAANKKVNTVSDVNGKTVNQVKGGGIPYTVRVTNAFNCSALADLAISENIIAPVVTLSQLTPNTICDATKATLPYNGSIQATVTFDNVNVPLPNNNYTFEWRNPANAVIAVADNKNPVLSGLRDGNSYSVTVRRNDLACVSAPDTEPVQKTTVLPQLETSQTGSKTCVGAATPDGTATVIVTNSVPADAFTYRWHSGNIADPAMVLGAANNFNQAAAIALGGAAGAPHPYTVLVLNTTTGCENTATQFVADESVIPVISFVNVTPNTICAPASAFTGSLTAQVNNQIGPITNYNFDWYNGSSTASPIISGVDGVLLSNRNVGFYTVEVLNTVTNCRSTAITNQVPDGRVFPAITFYPEGSNNCDASILADGQIEAIVINGGTNFSYAWTAVGTSPAINLATNNITSKTLINVGGPTGGNPPNSYQVLVTNTDTQCANSGIGQVPDLSVKPTLTLTPVPNSVCNNTIPGGPTDFNGSLTVSSVNHPELAGKTISYAWFDYSPTNVLIGPNASSTTAVLGNLDAGNHGVQVTINELGCTSNIVIEEVLETTPTLDIVFDIDPRRNCLVDDGGLAVTAPVGGSIQYQWYTGSSVIAGNEVVGATNAILGNNLPVGATRTVLVTNLADGCQYNEAATVTDGRILPTITLAVQKHNTICDIPTLQGDGELIANFSNAGTNFSLTWTAGGFQATPNAPLYTQLEPGLYTATIVDNDTDCQASDSETILNNITIPAIAVDVAPQTSCGPTPNGRLTITPVAGHTYAWFDDAAATVAHVPSLVNQITNLAAEDYTLLARNNTTGCEATQTFIVAQSTAIPVVTLANTVPVTTCGATPNGVVATTINGLSGAPRFAGNLFDVFYVFTPESGTPPTDVPTLKASGTNIINATTIPVADKTQLAPGFMTALVVDKNTLCESVIHTVPILDAIEEYAFTIDGKTSAGLCGSGGGGIEVTVERSDAPGVPCSTCTYFWYEGTPSNPASPDINFFNNPPDMSSAIAINAPQAVNEDLGAPAFAAGVGTGTYTLVVIDNDPAHLNCGNYMTDFVPPSSLPTVVTNVTNLTDCATPDGTIDVDVSGGTSTLGYTIRVFTGSNASGTLVGQLAVPAKPAHLGPIMNLANGEYYVEVTDNDLQNISCPFGEVVRVRQNVRPPVVTLTSSTANSSCIPATGDGQALITVANAPNDLTPSNYFVTAIAPPVAGYATPNVIGVSGSSETITGLSPTSYLITVTDQLSNCASTITVTIPDIKAMPGDLSLAGGAANPETMCAPLSNGNALASITGTASTDLDQFDFLWAQNSDLSGPVYVAPGDGFGTLGERINQAHATAGTPGNFWPMVGGNRTFFLQATKNAGSANGVGCKTGIIQVVIPDEHITPQITLAPATNSFCTAPNPGDLGDGSIAITVDADPSTPGTQVSTYNYTWTTPNAALSMPQNGAPNTLTIPQLGNGNYSVTALNTANGCSTTSATLITPEPFIFALTTSKLDQQICLPDGSINVTSIQIDRPTPKSDVNDNSGLLLTAVYDFQWFASTAGDPNVINMAPLQDNFAANIVGQSLLTGTTAGRYASMAAGTYYVMATRKVGSGVAEGCPVSPVRVDINDVHKNPLIDLRSFSNTSCLTGPGTGEGIIEIRVTDATPTSYNSGNPFAYNYDWTAGGIADPVGTSDGDGENIVDGDADRITNLLENTVMNPTYSLTVTNPSSGCFSAANTTIIKNATPIFIQNVLPAHQISCDPSGDGNLNVTKVTLNDRQGNVQSFTPGSPTSNIDDFEFTWMRSPALFQPVTLGPQTTAFSVTNPTANILDVNSYDPAFFGGNVIGAATYTVVATRTVAASPNDVGRGCSSAPFTVNILDKRINPVVTLTPFANTACNDIDPLYGEGSIEVRVADATLVAGPFTYTYAWSGTNPEPITTSTPGANDGDGNDLDSDEDNPGGLIQGTYAITVTNNQSQCSSIASTTIFQNSTPIIIPNATSTPQVLCSADGTMQVMSIEVRDRNGNPIPPNLPNDFDDYDFNWYNGDPSIVTNLVATTDGALRVAPGGTILDRTVYTGIQKGQYFVEALRVAGDLGRGCKSAPYHVTIDDQRVFPELTFEQEANSSCTNLNPNGEIIASARERNGTTPALGYSFGWAMNPGTVSPVSVQTNAPLVAPVTSTLSNALDGNYLVTATNLNTACPVTSPVTLVLDRSLSTPNIIEVTTVDPLDCNPTGQAAVTRITLGSTTNSILFPPNAPPNNEVSGAGLNAFDYEWYQGSVASGNQLPIGGPVFTTTPSINSLLTGTYFVVVHDPMTDCRSGAREVVITPADIQLPDLLVSQTALQISCRPGIGSAELSVTADNQDDTNPLYTFAWFANAIGTGTPIASTSTISNIAAGTYSVTVHNSTTNCSITDSYIVEDDTEDFTPIVSTSSQPRTLCVGTDGEISARVLNTSPLYPYVPYTANTFTADLYFGASPNLSVPADMPAITSTPGLIGNFTQNNLNEGFYTVRITDNNTGCFGVATEQIKDGRLYPVVGITELAPVTNCDPSRPNGVAQVTANNSFVGFTFEWYEGSTVAGAPVYTGAEFNELKVKPQQYVVRATNNISGCFTDLGTDIENGTVIPPAATIEVLSHVTSCIEDNGALAAYVGPDRNTAGYIFHWYDGTVENPPADNIGETYKDVPVGFYSVTATSVVTGCKSPLVTEEILNKQEKPDFDFVIQNTTCDQNDGFASLILLSNVPIERIEWSDSEGPFLTGPNFTDAAAGQYEVTATTFLGCYTTKIIEIKPDIRPYNGISRNGDGRNEFFKIDCIQNFPSNIVKIFNRAGTLVYEAENYDNTSTFFDGRSNRGISPMGVNLPDGTYYYIVDKRDGTKPMAGYLEIVK
jgi:large repetitive protein